MKSIYVFLLLIGFSGANFAQEIPSDFIASINGISISDELWTFKTSMTEAAKTLDDCAKEEGGCALKELEDDKDAPLLQQMIKAGISGANTQKIMVDFEKSILKGKGGKLLKRIDIVLAYEKHPGYSFSAMCNRMNIYIKKLSEKSANPVAEETTTEEIEEEYVEE